MTTVYEKLEKLSLPLIEAYHADLQKHDRQWLDENPGVPFLHATRECGTHLISLPAADSDYWPQAGERIPYLFGTADREHILADTASSIRAILRSEATRLLLYYDGRKLREIAPERAEQFIRDYVWEVRNAWKRQPVPA